ncbi:MAG: DUF2178 domain-containing protein [Steroidobacter sp.]
MKSFSFREMSSLGSAVGIVLAACLYFPKALSISAQLQRALGDAAVWGQRGVLIGLGVVSVIFLVVLQIVYHIVIGIIWRRDANEKMDERDRMVNLKAARVAYAILTISIWMTSGYLFLANVSAVQAVQYLFLSIFVSEFVRYGATFVYYRLSV